MMDGSRSSRGSRRPPGFPGRRGDPDRRARRSAAEVRRSSNASNTSAAMRRDVIQIAPDDETRAHLEGPQGGVRRDGPRLAELLRAGRRDSADEAAGSAAPDPRLETRSGLRIGNVFHAGDGNLHPLVCYDEGVAGTGASWPRGRGRDSHLLHRSGRVDHRRARRRRGQGPSDAEDVHADDLDTMQRVRCAFDPSGICNPTRSSRRRGCAAKSRAVPEASRRERAGLGERF